MQATMSINGNCYQLPIELLGFIPSRCEKCGGSKLAPNHKQQGLVCITCGKVHYLNSKIMRAIR